MTTTSLPVEGLGWRAAVVGFLSPAFIFALLMFLSGMPLLEASAHKKHGREARVPALFGRNVDPRAAPRRPPPSL